jgi:WD40 repeat protein
LYSAGAEYTLKRYDASTGADLGALALGLNPASIAISADGAFLAAGTTFGEVVFSDLRTEPNLKVARGPGGTVNFIANIPNTPFFLSASTGDPASSLPPKGRVSVWDARTGEGLITLPYRTSAVALSEGGRIVCIGEPTGAVHLFELMNLPE